MNREPGNYYLGLDIGTDSVGWALTDAEYNLCKHGGKELWGIRLFESGNQAAERRGFRAGRRRLERRKKRIDLLQMLFAEEMAKTDDTFFIRLNESRLHIEDKSVQTKYPLFIDKEYTDIDFHEKYQTIYHLRRELIHNKEPHDIRLVYLALHHIIKNRGHFLIDGDLKSAVSFESAFSQMMDQLNSDIVPFDVECSAEETDKIKAALKSQKTKSIKAKAIKLLFTYSDEGIDRAEEKKRKSFVENISKLMCGNKGDLSKIFYDMEFDNLDKTSFSFTEQSYEDTILPYLQENYPDHASIIESIKAVYDWSILSDILRDKKYLSDAKVEEYEKHKEDLKILHSLMKKYCDRETYKKYFNGKEEGTGYSNYIGEVKINRKKYSVKKCSDEEFFKNTKKILEGIDCSPTDENDYQYIMGELETGKLLPLQRSKNNSVIPRQVHQAELEAILDNVAAYLPFLNEKDENGKTVANKIISVFTFRIPYYVGPLSDRHKESGANQWIQRRKEGRIYPWNFSEMVDEEKSNQEFIRRMTNKCTYLPTEDVLPKDSLLYSKFMVLNELNNLTIRGKRVGVDVKQDIYRDLFMNKNKVTGKSLRNYLQKYDPDLKIEDIGGFHDDFKGALKSYLDFQKQIFGDRMAEDRIRDIAEDIIKWITIYDSDSQMIKRVIKNRYPEEFTEEELKKIVRLKFSGWGRLSRKFLSEIEGVNTETGEVYTLINALWETNDNLMQLLSSKYTFAQEIEKINAELRSEITEMSYDSLIKDLYVSPAVKRGIWQTIQITEELCKVQGSAPKKIFVEMARGEEEKKEEKLSRKKRLLELYEGCRVDARNWSKEIESRDERAFSSMKLFLYYSQLGRDMYTWEPIDIEQLMAGNSKWDRDHIYPQSKIKDDSIDNLVLVNKVSNSKKSNGMISPETQSNMLPHWKELLRMGLISKKKFDRLTRKGEFTEDELSGFIARQLVETRQSSKVVADLLQRIYPNSKVVYVKARLASDFRKDDLAMLKSRRINDYHHAKDAYLNIVVGNVYNTRFTSDPRKWMKENKDSNYTIHHLFRIDTHDMHGNPVWIGPDRDTSNNNRPVRNEYGGIVGGTIDRIRSTMLQNNIFYTEYAYCETGALFNATVQKKGAKSATIPLKKDLPISKYGGYYSPGTSYFAMIEYDGNKNTRTREILGVPIYVTNLLEQDPEAFINYCENVKEYSNVRVIYDRIKKNALLSVNGFPLRIRGENDKDIQFKNNMQLKLDTVNELTIKNIEKFLAKNSDYEVDPKFDRLNNADLISLYDVFTEKLLTIYKNRPANQGKKLEYDREKFIELKSDKERAKVLNEILTMLRCDIATTADLSLLGEGSHIGNIAINKNTLSNKSKLVLINQSVTGVFENRIRL